MTFFHLFLGEGLGRSINSFSFPFDIIVKRKNMANKDYQDNSTSCHRFHPWWFIIVFTSFCMLLKLQTGYLFFEAKQINNNTTKWWQFIIALTFLDVYIYIHMSFFY